MTGNNQVPPNYIIIISDIKLFIGVGRFRILGGPRFRILGGQGGGGKFPADARRRNDVDAT